MNEVEGTIKIIGEAQTYGASFRKREFILTTEEKFPQDVKFELYQDDCSLIDTEDLGDKVKVFFNLKGNEYKGKYYVNLQAWKIQKDAESPQEEVKKSSSSEKSSAPEAMEDLAASVSELADAPF
jgi:single-strand DNA-binding protein